MRDLLSGAEYQWGEHNYVRLDPHAQSGAHLRGARRSERTRCRTGPPSPTGSSAPSSTRCSSAASPTPTATAPATCAACSDKLDYLQWLGVDCLWLPPFYPSPLRDGGYDVSDYTGVLPEFGTIDDFKSFLDAAHARGMRVIIDFVMNHTSDQHPWFQASRSDPDGPYGDFYVWNDDDTRYPEARIIFVDTEPSNWTFDPVRKQYFWHRFFSHQPDLNFDSPDVQQAILDALRFWLDLGIDGFRLDAVPYLYVRDGTNGENLPETHEFLQAGAQGGRPRLPRPGAAVRGEPVAGRRRRVLRRPGRRRRRVPHGVPLPGDAAHLHGRAPRVALPDLGDHGADAGDPGQLPVGHLPAQPRRADARDGHRRGARLHVERSTPRTRG